MVAVVLLSSCAGSVAAPRGWSGATVSNGVLYIGSMNGQLEAVDLSTHTRAWGKALESKATAIYGTPAVGTTYVYVGGYDGKMYAFAPGNGDAHDPFDTTTGQPIISSPLLAMGNIYFGSSDGRLYALKQDTLAKLWQFPAKGSLGKIWSTPVADANTVYFTSLDKNLYAIDAAAGAQKWKFPTDGAIVGSPVISNNTLYFGSIDKHVYAVNTADGTLKWKSTAPATGWFWTSVILNNNLVYAPCLDGKVYIFNAATGATAADAVILDGPSAANPVLAGNNIIVASEAGHVYAIDTTNYQKRELNNLSQTINAPLASANGSVFVHTTDDTLSALDASSGIVQWKLSLKQ